MISEWHVGFEVLSAFSKVNRVLVADRGLRRMKRVE